MPLDKIYVTRHGHRLNWSIDLDTGTYHATYPTPTGIPVDPTLTGPGVRQSRELAAHLSSSEFSPKPCRVYSSPFYRCLQTIQPSVEALKGLKKGEKHEDADLNVRMENGLGEWFGPSSFFTHPSSATPEILQPHFPTILPLPQSPNTYNAHIYPSSSGESIAELHDRLATTLEAIITDVDAEIEKYEQAHPQAVHESHAILICTHAAPLIALGRALTGNMPDDSSTEDFKPFTASLSTFARRKGVRGNPDGVAQVGNDDGNARTTSGRKVPQWRHGKGVAGGWDCVGNGECDFLSAGQERGWRFSGEEDFNSMSSPPAPPAGNVSNDSAKL